MLPLQEVFPDVIVDGAVDRTKLMSKVMEDPASLQVIERIVHPLVIAERKRFYHAACMQRRLIVVYDIPLLFENMAKYSVDYIVVATASAEVQKRRVMARPGMTEEKFQAILLKQVSDEEKRRKAHFLIHTDHSSSGFTETKSQVATIVESIIQQQRDTWEVWKTGPAQLNSAYGESAVRERVHCVKLCRVSTVFKVLVSTATGANLCVLNANQ